MESLGPTGDGHTLLTDEDRHGLIPTYIATRGDLFDAEQRNIAQGLLRRAPSYQQLLDDRYLRNLHRAMFGNVWRWAGTYRRRETNIGIDPVHISVAVRTLAQDARAWIDHEAFGYNELALRFHHRLVAIHPFPNGNGRHGRVAADLLMTALGERPFSWGAALQIPLDHLRSEYIQALRRADGGDFVSLIEFSRA
jgi:Fic-DOC domain mobile mystery protein B